MSLQRAGWLGGRPFAVIKNDDGSAAKFIDLRTGFETEPDPDVFTGINWVEQENKSKAIDPLPMAGERRPVQLSTVIPPANPLDGIDWGSGKAAELAAEAGLEFEDFVGREPGGTKGFNADDVKTIIEEKTASEPEELEVAESESEEKGTDA